MKIPNIVEYKLPIFKPIFQLPNLQPTMQPSTLRTMFTTGLICGALDGLAAVLMYSVPSGKDPLNVFRFIACCVCGKEAFAGGVPMAMWGMLFYYVIATGWRSLFFAAYPRVAILSRNRVATAICYGVFV